MKVDLILWDWNGTLLDDAAWCVAVTNRMLSGRGLPIMTLGSYRDVFSFPVEDYYRKIGFDLTAEPFADLSLEYITLYHGNDHTYGLHKEALPALEAFRRLNVPQAVLSASEQNNLQSQIDEYNLCGYFQAVLGIHDIYARSKLDVGRRFLQQMGNPNSLLVGDTTHDWEVAAALGIDCVLIPQGHQSRHVLETCGARIADDLLGLIKQI